MASYSGKVLGHKGSIALYISQNDITAKAKVFANNYKSDFAFDVLNDHFHAYIYPYRTYHNQDVYNYKNGR